MSTDDKLNRFQLLEYWSWQNWANSLFRNHDNLWFIKSSIVVSANVNGDTLLFIFWCNKLCVYSLWVVNGTFNTIISWFLQWSYAFRIYHIFMLNEIMHSFHRTQRPSSSHITWLWMSTNNSKCIYAISLTFCHYSHPEPVQCAELTCALGCLKCSIKHPAQLEWAVCCKYTYAEFLCMSFLYWEERTLKFQRTSMSHNTWDMHWKCTIMGI